MTNLSFTNNPEKGGNTKVNLLHRNPHCLYRIEIIKIFYKNGKDVGMA